MSAASTAGAASAAGTMHTLSVLVEDTPGVLTRVSALFTRRGFNIRSLAVGPTDTDGVSRITVIADAEGRAMEQVTKQLNKLVNVLKIVELDPATSVERELYLIKVHADDANRTAVLQIVDLFRAHVVDVSPSLGGHRDRRLGVEGPGTADLLGALRGQGDRPVRCRRHHARSEIHHRST